MKTRRTRCPLACCRTCMTGFSLGCPPSHVASPRRTSPRLVCIQHSNIARNLEVLQISRVRDTPLRSPLPAKATVLSAARASTNDWLDKKGEACLEVDWSTKLAFMTSDIIRYATVNMRVAQFLEAMSPAFKHTDTFRRVTFNHFEVVAALHLWFRQIQLVKGRPAACSKSLCCCILN